MNEIRQNKVTNQWMTYALILRMRPHFFRQQQEKEALPILIKLSFGLGNEKMLLIS
jgi:hypothetical protein